MTTVAGAPALLVIGLAVLTGAGVGAVIGAVLSLIGRRSTDEGIGL